MVLEKDSSVLGYPGEMSKGLDADHHGVCKYDSPDDPNYVNVRNVLKTVMSKILATKKPSELSAAHPTQHSDLKAMLSIDQLPDADYTFFQDQRTQGTNGWITEDPSFREWLHSDSSTSRMLWLHGGPAAGKSIMSSFIVNYLVAEGRNVQYFFIRFSDQKKRNLSVLLRSIAYQIARAVPEFEQMLAQMGDAAVDLNTADASTVWSRIFRSLLFTIDSDLQLFWVIDGLDEADDPRAIVRIMSDVSSSSLPIHVLFVSRETPQIQNAIQKAFKSAQFYEIGIEGRVEDMRSFIQHDLSISGSVAFQKSVETSLLEGAQNNFLVSICIFPQTSLIICFDTNELTYPVGSACSRQNQLVP